MPTRLTSRIVHRSLSGAPPPVAAGGHGAWLRAADGREYLDASGGLAYAYFVSGGSEAVEASVTMARQYFIEIGQAERTRFIARRQSYHGNTLGGAVGRRQRMAPGRPDGPGLVACIRDGLAYSAADYQAMRARKYAYVTAIHRWFAGYDLLLTPSVSVPAFPLPALMPPDWPQHPWDWLSWAEFSYPFNLSSNPAASIPCGFTDGGLPIGLQIVGRRFDELDVLKASAVFEAMRPWAGARPSLRIPVRSEQDRDETDVLLTVD